jgi:hypothetical protein
MYPDTTALMYDSVATNDRETERPAMTMSDWTKINKGRHTEAYDRNFR